MREKHKHPATRSFQAIRIFINGELDEITAVLEQVIDVLAPQGRMAVISFHSLEDRIVKRFIRDEYRGEQPPEEFPLAGMDYVPRLRPVGKAIRAGAAEVDQNPRARSAVLRVAERLQ
jgi:16S rRNA (cytosine1402-N4)-methyltransferase